MEEDIRIQLTQLYNQLEKIELDAEKTKKSLEELNDSIEEKGKKSIKNIEDLKRELRRADLCTDDLEDFLDNYMRYYNK